MTLFVLKLSVYLRVAIANHGGECELVQRGMRDGSSLE